MKIIEPSYEILTQIDAENILRLIESAGRVCYKSEGNIEEGTAWEFVKRIIKQGHESVLEHFNVSVRFICNRGFTHEMVRHRIASYSQESTRYCNYSLEKNGGQVTFIKPIWFEHKPALLAKWKDAMVWAESFYLDLLRNEASPQQARGVLPIDLKTEIIVTANLREWRHIFKLRTSQKAHPSMRQLMVPLLAEMKTLLPIIFEGIGDERI